jgi:hypothetical protein
MDNAAEEEKKKKKKKKKKAAGQRREQQASNEGREVKRLETSSERDGDAGVGWIWVSPGETAGERFTVRSVLVTTVAGKATAPKTTGTRPEPSE